MDSDPHKLYIQTNNKKLNINHRKPKKKTLKTKTKTKTKKEKKKRKIKESSPPLELSQHIDINNDMLAENSPKLKLVLVYIYTNKNHNLGEFTIFIHKHTL